MKNHYLEEIQSCLSKFKDRKRTFKLLKAEHASKEPEIDIKNIVEQINEMQTIIN